MTPDQIAQLEALVPVMKSPPVVELREYEDGLKWKLAVRSTVNDSVLLSKDYWLGRDGNGSDMPIDKAFLEMCVSMWNARPALAQLLAAWREAEARITELERERDRFAGLAEGREKYIAVAVARAQAAEADCAALREALLRLVEWGDPHENPECPEDDTCECEVARLVNYALAQPHPGQALLDRLARAERVVDAAKSLRDRSGDPEADGLWSALRAALAAVERAPEKPTS